MTSTGPEIRRALVTGASGFAGRHLVRQLGEAGADVIAPSSADIDIADEATLTALIDGERPDVVFHLAAIVDTVTTPSVQELERVNVGGTRAVAAAVAAVDPSIRIVFASSAFVYGRTEPEEQPIGEAHPLRPLTPYGETKVAAERVLLDHVAAGGNAVIARSFQHTGPGHVGAYALPDWAERLARIERSGEPGEISTGNLDVERDYLDVRDVTAAYVALASRGGRGEIYNVSSGRGITMRALLEGLIEAFGVDAAPAVDPARVRAVDQPIVIGDRRALTATTGWEPEIAIAQTLADLAAFWRERI